MLVLVLAGVLGIATTTLSYVIIGRVHSVMVVRQRLQAFSLPQDVKIDEASNPGKGEESAVKKLLSQANHSLGLKQSKQLEMELARADIKLKPGEFVVLNAFMALAPLTLTLIGYSILPSLLFSLCGAMIPQFYVRFRQVDRLKKTSAQIPEALVMISNALKAGYSFMQAMDLVSQEMPAPIAQEFSKVLKEMSLGVTTEASLQSMVDRVNSDDLDLVITAVLIQRQVGGNLSEILDSIAHTIRERIRIKGEIKTLTAQGRISGLVISALPAGIGFFIYLINPEYMTALFTETLGQIMLAIGLFGQIIAAFLIKKIVNIQV